MQTDNNSNTPLLPMPMQIDSTVILQFDDGTWLQGSLTRTEYLQTTSNINKAKKYKSLRHLQDALCSYLADMIKKLSYYRRTVEICNHKCDWETKRIPLFEEVLKRVALACPIQHTHTLTPINDNDILNLLDSADENAND